ncbi:membrane protein [Enterococcus florum]|uniref:Membrane protein n=1 Tax=Enterococcus florum TaxID=2480627 RepID=A0A4P5P722_9ENTE|nr:DUF389 domain-containing protein [Enterococcus florum]GCF93236.1 membrane protein [Enterococcus florum]
MNLKPDFLTKDTLINKVYSNMDQTILVYGVLIFATLMASIGLNYNSTTTIIGAMLISPLMSGISGIGVGLGLSLSKMVRKGIGIFFIQFAIILSVSFLFFWLTPIKEPTPEITSRTSATIWDILVASIAGGALTFATIRGKDNNVIIGVSIGTSLILPLCVTGYGLAGGDFSIAAEAAKLFFINVFLIFLVVSLIIYFLHYEKGTRKKKLLAIFLLSVVLAGTLVFSTVQSTVTEYRAKQFAEHALADYYILSQEIERNQRTIQLTVVGTPLHDNQVQQLENQLTDYHLNNFELRITVRSNEDGSIDAAELAKILNQQNKGTSKFLGLE